MDLTPDSRQFVTSSRYVRCIRMHSQTWTSDSRTSRRLQIFEDIDKIFKQRNIHASETRKLFILNTIMCKKWYHRLSGEEFIANVSPSFLNVFFFYNTL